MPGTLRVLMVNASRRRIGGAETYVADSMQDLAGAGHSIALLTERDTPVTREPMGLPAGAPWWNVETIGETSAVAGVRDWRPDVILSHGVVDPHLEPMLLPIASLVVFAHNYYGTCISGTKTHSSPDVHPCSKVFGPACLLHYYPHSCGGRSPVTMLRNYRNQSVRLSLLRRCAAVITGSNHMRNEYVRHGLVAERVITIPYPLPDLHDGAFSPARESGSPRDQLLFVGRMDRLKGGAMLVAALPLAARALDRALTATFVGDGPARPDWEARARAVERETERVRFSFAGWQQDAAVTAWYARSDLLIVPSLWPEPFGLVGPEAGRWELPAVAFDVGGIREWLRPGVNGFLAPGDPPTVEGLAAAIAQALADPMLHRRLGEGARRVAATFSRDAHRSALTDVLHTAVDMRAQAL